MATIRKLLEINSTNLPDKVLGKVDTYDGLIADETEHGWLIWVPPEIDSFFAEYDQPPPGELLDVLRYAAKLDCRYVLVDRDADRDEDLPYYGW